eukprot:GHVR01016307.1.p1 GENE.GHVR01016307.1~~GHVR01016307.1.p1  ORF type:complete len:333 (+),score=139.20 GHVR01016307.1:42-1040(+)
MTGDSPDNSAQPISCPGHIWDSSRSNFAISVDPKARNDFLARFDQVVRAKSEHVKKVNDSEKRKAKRELDRASRDYINAWLETNAVWSGKKTYQESVEEGKSLFTTFAKPRLGGGHRRPGPRIKDSMLREKVWENPDEFMWSFWRDIARFTARTPDWVRSILGETTGWPQKSVDTWLEDRRKQAALIWEENKNIYIEGYSCTSPLLTPPSVLSRLSSPVTHTHTHTLTHLNTAMIPNERDYTDDKNTHTHTQCDNNTHTHTHTHTHTDPILKHPHSCAHSTLSPKERNLHCVHPSGVSSPVERAVNTSMPLSTTASDVPTYTHTHTHTHRRR